MILSKISELLDLVCDCSPFRNWNTFHLYTDIENKIDLNII